MISSESPTGGQQRVDGTEGESGNYREIQKDYILSQGRHSLHFTTWLLTVVFVSPVICLFSSPANSGQWEKSQRMQRELLGKRVINPIKARCSEKPWLHLFQHDGARKGYSNVSRLKIAHYWSSWWVICISIISTKTWRWVRGHMSRRQEHRAEPISTDLEVHPGAPRCRDSDRVKRLPLVSLWVCTGNCDCFFFFMFAGGKITVCSPFYRHLI